MNWRRGLLRAWIVGSAMWIAVVAAFAVQDWRSRPIRPQAETKSMICTENPHPPEWCSYPAATPDEDLVPFRAAPYLVWGTTGPALALAGGVLIFWVLAGFRAVKS